MTMLQSQDPWRNAERFVKELETFHNSAYELGQAVDPLKFFARPQIGWSIAENFSHITRVCKTMRLIFSPVHAPASLLLGTAPAERPDLKKVMEDYHAGLRKGFAAGPFSPSKEGEASDADTAARRKAVILEAWKESWKPLAQNVRRYNDEELQRKQFYHPILGRIPLIEAAYMAIFHSLHHLHNASRKAGMNLAPDFL